LNKHVSDFDNSKGILNIPWRFHFLVCGIGLFIIIAMTYGFYLGNHMVVKYIPLIDATMEIKLEATTAHLWFEEIVSGDRFEDIDQVHQHLDQAQWYATAMLAGGSNLEGTFIPLKEPVLRFEIEKVFEKIGTFREITSQRYEAIQESGIGTVVDQRYDSIFRDFIGQADRVESMLQAKVATEMYIYRIIQFTLVAIALLLLAGLVVLFHRFERRRSSDMRLISEMNEDLQKALQEVKSLQGIIPICSYCKKIRDEKGLWSQLEIYIHEHSEAQFSHGACPDCYKEQMEEIEILSAHNKQIN
jgi:hypothetical protein